MAGGMMPPDTSGLDRLIGSVVDPEWYRARYPDVAAASLDPVEHFVRFGAVENRDPNRFFDSTWYMEHYPDVATGGFDPIRHYFEAGAGELRNPHPRFDAPFYVRQHPEAAANPLLYHLRVGLSRGYMTEQPTNIRNYLPSEAPALGLPRRVFVDVIIAVSHGLAAARRCVTSVLSDRAVPLARVIVIDDGCREPGLSAWLRALAAEGEIHLLRNRRRLGFAACANLGIDAAEGHDVVLLPGSAAVSPGWLRRLTAQAWADPRIATVSPFSNVLGPIDTGWNLSSFGQQATALDEVCGSVNRGRWVDLAAAAPGCRYIRRAAIQAVGRFADGSGSAMDFCRRATQAGWQHRLACDTFVHWGDPQTPGSDEAEWHGKAPIPGSRADPEDPLAQDIAAGAADPFRFAVTAALFRKSGLPVILMVSHDLGGGIRRHIEGLAQRYRGSACVLLLAGSDRGAALSVPGEPAHPVVTLPSDRIDDMVQVLRSANLSRVHIHHQLHIDMDIRRLIHRIGVTFDVTVHDYYAVCPQVNLLRSAEEIYCGEPGPAGCNTCIAALSSHGSKDILSWRKERAWQFLDAERVICPSHDVKARLTNYGVGENAIVVPHEVAEPGCWPMEIANPGGPPLRIVLLGVLADHKGARTVAGVAQAAGDRLDIHLIGHLEASFPSEAAGSIKSTGPYAEAELDNLLRRIEPQVFWFPSSAPETYSYTLSTAIASGLPIVATRLGSFPERLAGRPHTWLVDHRASIDDYLAVFDAVQAQVSTAAAAPRVSRPVDNSDFYQRRYLAPGTAGRAPARARSRPRIVILPERHQNGSLTPCAYIRLLQPLDHPEIGGGFEILVADAETVFDHRADIIATQRLAVADVDMANRLAAHARRIGATLLFDLDDDLLRIPPNHPDAEQLRPRAKVVRRMLTLADAVWLSTTDLADRLAAIRPTASVIENRLDERIWVAPPALAPYWDDPVRILCMGTSTHDRDFALIEPALERLKSDYGQRIVIDVLGMTAPRDLPRGINRIGPSPHAARSYPGFVDWIRSEQPAWHIGLAPLLDTPFNRGKSPIKAMDYAAIGLPTLASDVAAYRGSIADGPAGRLVANDPLAWHAALDWLIRDQVGRRGMAQAARAAFADRGTLISDAQRRRAALMALLPRLQGGSGALTMGHDQSQSVTRKRHHRGGGR
jgi:glycosyltransferase involved in cell wall biosynthesis